MKPSPTPPPRAEELLRHARWMESLARSLVRDRAAVDDLVQDTWVAALKRPPEREVRPWLRRVLGNLALMRARGEGRRLQRETASASTAEATAPAPDALVERGQTEKTLTDLVLALDEPYRSTLIWRYYDGLSAAQIARRQGVPAGTVRWRLKQALDELRRKLDDEHQGDRRAWRRALLPLAFKSGKPGGGVIRWLGWGAAVVAPIAALVAIVTQLGGPKNKTPFEKPFAAHRELEPGGLRRPAATVMAPPVDARAAHGEFLGQVRSRLSGAPIANAILNFHHEGAIESATTDDHGEFDFRPSAPGRFELMSVTAPQFVPLTPDFDTGPRTFVATAGVRLEGLMLYLDLAHEVTGTVLAPGGRPVEGARVRVYTWNGMPAAPPNVFVTDARGEFHVQAAGDEQVEVAHKEWATAHGVIDMAAWQRRQVTLKFAEARREPEREIRGQVLDADGGPLEGAQVTSHPMSAASMSAAMVQAVSGADGRFTLEGLEPGTYTVHASAGEVQAGAENVHPGESELVLRTARGGVIRGVVRDTASKNAITSFVIIAKSTDHSHSYVDGPYGAHVVSADGRFELRGVAPGTYDLHASASGALPPKPLRVTLRSIAEPVEVELALAPGRKLRGRVLDAATGAPLMRAQVRFNVAQYDDVALTDEAGSFELDGLGPGRTGIIVGALDHHSHAVGGLTGGEQPITVELHPIAPGETQHVEYCGFGFNLQPTADGLLVKSVMPNSGALEAGLREGDVLLALDGRSLAAMDDTLRDQFLGAENSVAQFTVKRGGETLEVPVKRKALISDG